MTVQRQRRETLEMPLTQPVASIRVQSVSLAVFPLHMQLSQADLSATLLHTAKQRLAEGFVCVVLQAATVDSETNIPCNAVYVLDTDPQDTGSLLDVAAGLARTLAAKSSVAGLYTYGSDDKTKVSETLFVEFDGGSPRTYVHEANGVYSLDLRATPLNILHGSVNIQA
jgi:hypothetical protein